MKIELEAPTDAAGQRGRLSNWAILKRETKRFIALQRKYATRRGRP
jgi:hypothetical protein